jgi:serine protease Do
MLTDIHEHPENRLSKNQFGGIMGLVARLPAVPHALAYVLVIACCLIGRGAAVAQIPELSGGKMPTLAPLVREVTPGVVNLSVQGRVREDNPHYQNPLFNEFFDGPRDFEREVRAVGSGVIVDAEEGYVLTANHVVAQVSIMQVTTKDGRRFVAKLVGRDPGTDLAVLRLQGAQSLKAIPMGDSDSLEVGDFVIAVGNPFGLGQTVTSGLVSALGRSGIMRQGYEDFIQTDAPINPGNSGGALVNLRGELVGINSAIFSTGGGNVGIGFAVPINMARLVMKQIVQHGRVRRGRIGITVEDLTATAGKPLTGSIDGALITEVVRGSAAERNGIQKGDVVVAADGLPIRSAARLRNKLGLTAVGERVQLTVKRQGVVRNVTVEVAAAGDTAVTSSISRQPQPRAASHPSSVPQ